MGRKFIHCFTCNDTRWADHVVGFNYECHECDSVIDLRKSKVHEKKERERLKLVKGKVYIKGKTVDKKARKREVDESYLDFIREQPCLVSDGNCNSKSHAHHLITQGACGSDYTAIPLCMKHHTFGIHTMGVLSFCKHYRIDPIVQVKRLWILYKIRWGKEISPNVDLEQVRARLELP